MYKNRIDMAKNRYYVTFQGKMEVEEIKQAAAEALQMVKQLKRGFGTVSDISTAIPANEEGRLLMQNAMKALKEAGMGQVVRIVPPAATVMGNQWQRSSRAVGYSADEAPTLAEAERRLDDLEKG